MSTNSAIGMLNPDGTIRAIYAHWDGYPEHNGRILLNHYTTASKISLLLDGGDISILGMDIGNKHDFDGPIASASDEKTRFAYETTYYRRDRGEYNHGHGAGIYRDLNNFRDNFRGPFFYLFEHNEWSVQWGGSPWLSLRAALAKIDQKVNHPKLLPSPR